MDEKVAWIKERFHENRCIIIRDEANEVTLIWIMPKYFDTRSNMQWLATKLMSGLQTGKQKQKY
jgi:hypothetical protein